MARLFMEGFESRAMGVGGVTDGSVGDSGFAFSTFGGTAVSTDTTHIRSGTIGTACCKVGPAINSGGGASVGGFLINITMGRTYYARCCYMYPALPAGVRTILSIWDSGTLQHGASVEIDSSGNISLWADATQIGSTTQISANTWFVVEVGWTPNTTAATDYIELRVNGTSVALSNTATTTKTGGDGTTFAFGAAVSGTNMSAGSPSTETMYFDDAAFNDSTTAVNNSWCGLGSVGMLLPVSDNTVGTWTGGAGGTSNLYTGVDNAPPVGVAVGSATNTSQIVNVNASGAQAYVVNLESYTTFGIAGGTVLVACVPVVFGATGTAVSTTASTAATNPTRSAVSGNWEQGGANAGGTFPVGWQMQVPFYNAVRPVDGSTAVLGNQPTVTISKTTAAATSLMASFIGMMFEAPAPSAPVVPTSYLITQPVLRRRRRY